MPLFDIVITDLKVRINHTQTAQKQSFPRNGYRFELRGQEIVLLEAGTGQKVLAITDINDVGTITDNRTTPGATGPYTTLDELYEIMDAAATPFFFRSLGSGTGGPTLDPFILEDGTINPASTAIIETVSFDSSSNNILLNDINSNFELTGDANYFAFTTDGAGSTFNDNWIYGDRSTRETSFGLGNGNGAGEYGFGGFGSTLADRRLFINLGNEVGASQPLEIYYNRGVSRVSGAADTFPLILSSPSVTIPSNRENAVAAAFRGGTLDQDDTLFSREFRGDSNLNNQFISDANSNAAITFGELGGDNVSIYSDGLNNYDGSYINIDDTFTEYGIGFGFKGGTDMLMNADRFTISKAIIAGIGVANELGNVVEVLDNTGGNRTSVPAANAWPVFVGGRRITANQNITNSVGLGGNVYTINESNAAFAQNLRATSTARYTTTPLLSNPLDFATIDTVNNARTSVVNVAANYTANNGDFVLMTTGATDKTVTLPAATANAVINVKKVDAGAGNVIIDGDGAETIDGNLTVTVAPQWDSISLHSDGTNWFIK